MATPYYRWDDGRFSVDFPPIDDQHKKLFVDINALIALLENSQVELSELEAVVDDLIDYIGYHFSFEEKLLAKHPDFAAHRNKHQLFTEKIREVDRGLLGHKPIETATGLYVFLGDWLQNHIQTEDRLYFGYLHRNNLLPSA